MRGLAGVHKLDGQPLGLGFVGDKPLQLRERPSGDHAVQMLIPGAGSLPDPLQFFQSDDRASVCSGLFDNLLAQAWFSSRVWRRSFPDSRFRSRLAPFVPFEDNDALTFARVAL